MPTPLTAKEPFPTTEGIYPDAYSLRVISPAYSSPVGELNAILQYTYHSLNFRAAGYSEYADVIERISIAEMLHFELLGTTILALGAAPVFSANPPGLYSFYSTKYVTYSRTLVCMIEDDIRAEKQAIRGYEKMLCYLRNAKVKEIIARILKDERLHLEEFEKILTELKGGGGVKS